MQYVLSFVYHYPLFMAFVWILGSLVYRTRRAPYLDAKEPAGMEEYPGMSILVPCHNEADSIAETLERLSELDYPDYEIIAIDDGSSDDTWRIIRSLAGKIQNLRSIRIKKNGGKAAALRLGLVASRHEYLVSIDADSYITGPSLKWIAWHFVKFPRVGAVTGNPRIRNRTTLLSKIQVGEYSTIIGMIKRTQRIIGKVFTVSGVVAAFRKEALLEVGAWSEDMVTEDIDVTWKLQTNFWDIRFEEHALCWILTPETLRGLWKQRVRWAQGGAEVILKYGRVLLSFKQRRLWPLYIEYLTSVIWSYAFWLCAIIGALNIFFELPSPFSLAQVVPPQWTGTLLACVCMLQAITAMFFDRHYESRTVMHIFWFIWFPMVYWVLSAMTTAVGMPKAVIKSVTGNKSVAVWDSPDRGLR